MDGTRLGALGGDVYQNEEGEFVKMVGVGNALQTNARMVMYVRCRPVTIPSRRYGNITVYEPAVGEPIFDHLDNFLKNYKTVRC